MPENKTSSPAPEEFQIPTPTPEQQPAPEARGGLFKSIIRRIAGGGDQSSSPVDSADPHASRAAAMYDIDELERKGIPLTFDEQVAQERYENGEH